MRRRLLVAAARGTSGCAPTTAGRMVSAGPSTPKLPRTASASDDMHIVLPDVLGPHMGRACCLNAVPWFKHEEQV
jgi:hypothetical protein